MRDTQKDRAWRAHPVGQRQLLDASPARHVAAGLVAAGFTFASFAGVAAIEGASILGTGIRSVAGLSVDAWSALVISLFAWAFVTANRLAGQRNLKDLYSLAPKLAGVSGAELVSTLEPSPDRRRVGWLGALAGLPLGAAIFIGQRFDRETDTGWFDDFTLTDYWAFAATMVLTGLVVRWVVVAQGEASSVTDRMLGAAKIDLLSRSGVEVVGHIALRGALVWLLHAAILFLLFVGDPLNTALIVTFAAIVAIAIMVFVTPLRWAQRLIARTKAEEIANLHEEIREARAHLSDTGETGAAAASRLAGLLAYEARIEKISEWPLDLGTMARFVGLLSLPILSWTGGAFAERFIDWVVG